MTVKITGENKKIAKIRYYKMIPVIIETLLHESLKYSWRTLETIRYPYSLTKSPWKDESSEIMTFRTYRELTVYLSLVEDTKVLASPYILQYILYFR